MILNYDCLRDVLLSLETNLSIDKNLRFTPIVLEDIFNFKQLNQYTREDIFYCIFNLKEIKFINGLIKFADGGYVYRCEVTDITYAGHEFIQSIKSETTWKKIKTSIKPFAGLSIPLITEIAKEIIVSSIVIK